MVRVSALTTRRRCLLGDRRRRKPLLRRPPLRHRCLSSVRGRVPVLRGEEAAAAACHVEHLRRREAKHGRVPCPLADPRAPVHGSHPTAEKTANRGGVVAVPSVEVGGTVGRACAFMRVTASARVAAEEAAAGAGVI